MEGALNTSIPAQVSTYFDIFTPFPSLSSLSLCLYLFWDGFVWALELGWREFMAFKLLVLNANEFSEQKDRSNIDYVFMCECVSWIIPL